jgi:microcin C transport system substrate-binding protein
VGCRPAVARGQNNFDIVRYEYYRDREVAFEGFTARSYLFREEFTSRTWATRYDFPAIREGHVKRDVIPDDTPSGAQGWFFNTRREKLQNKRLREAFIDAFDFEWTNKKIMYGSYQRTHSVFQNSDMMAVGKPSADELACSNHSAARCPMRCSENLSFRRFPMDQVRICAAAQGRRALAGGRFRHQGRQAGDAAG